LVYCEYQSTGIPQGMHRLTPSVPPGTYVISKPIIQYYYTQLVGDAVTLPTIKGAPSFSGMALIDADPYADGGV
jgi:hypothetical protein